MHTILAHSDSAMYGLKRVGKKAADLIPEKGYPLHPKLRAWLDGCTGCWAECEVMPSAIYSGDLLRGLLG